MWSWKSQNGEQQFLCDRPHAVLTALLRLVQSLKHWRGECGLELSCGKASFELLFQDLFEEKLSYQWLNYGEGKVDKRRFTRMEYGHVDVMEFHEILYAAITDLMMCLGTDVYASILGASFPLGDYQKLAVYLRRPKDLPARAVDEEPEITEEDGASDGALDAESDIEIDGHEVIWESGDDESEDSWMDIGGNVQDGKELVQHPEFHKLAWLIDKDDSTENSSDESSLNSSADSIEDE